MRSMTLAVMRIGLARVGADEGRADGAAVVELVHVQQARVAAGLGSEFIRLFAEVRLVLKDEVEVTQGVALVAGIAVTSVTCSMPVKTTPMG